MSSKLEVRQLEKSFAGLKAVDGVDMDLATGEILGLIGPNGSGKTTFVNLLTGLLPVTGGTIKIDGVDITRMPAHRVARAGLARTYQTIRLFKNLEVLENVEVAAVSAGYSRKAARNKSLLLLEEVGLIDKKDCLAGSLTFAAQRRLELARSLALEPKFLLLDEPAAGLNEEETVELLDLFKPMPKTKGIGLLVIDHDMHLMMNLCHRLQVFNYGKTIAQGTPDEIRKNPEVIAAYLGGGDDE